MSEIQLKPLSEVSNRNFGIGSDGLILIMPTDKADVRIRMFNSDGSESEMFGFIDRTGKMVVESSFEWD